MVVELDDLQLECLNGSLGESISLLRLLANRERFLLLARLARGEYDVGQLGRDLAIVQPTLSQQLAVLRRARLVATRRDGKHVYYRTVSGEALALIGTLCAGFVQTAN